MPTGLCSQSSTSRMHSVSVLLPPTCLSTMLMLLLLSPRLLSLPLLSHLLHLHLRSPWPPQLTTPTCPTPRATTTTWRPLNMSTLSLQPQLCSPPTMCNQHPPPFQLHLLFRRLLSMQLARNTTLKMILANTALATMTPTR